jgi:indole-3-glycerol phosphate synthase
MGRFSQAISEGDGISVIPLLDADVHDRAAAAKEAGAEAIGVAEIDGVEWTREIELPVLVRELRARSSPAQVAAAGGDAYVLVFAELTEPGSLVEDLHAEAIELGLDCVVAVHDEDELERVLERVDPDIVLISRRAEEPDEDGLERALDVLPDVPAGKLVIAESGVIAREQVLALERAGVDAIVVRGLGEDVDFARAVGELVGNQAGR